MKMKKKNEADRDVNADAAASNVNNANIMPPVDLVSNLYIDMLKEIIMCDYNHVDYIPKTDDDILSLATLVKSRKKVTGLLTKGIEQQTADQFVLLDISRLYDPDDDKEEREERRKLALERLEELEETLRQWKDLSNLPGDKEVERYIEVKLGLAIASITAHRQFPEVGFTYKQLAFELFPEARTKRDQELEPYIQRVVRAIDAVQIHIITTFFKKTTIRIFPIALPSTVDNVERVFNGYKKKYVDKVLCEFITT